MLAVDCTFEFGTDVATLAIFDPTLMDKYKNEAPDWWADDFTQITETQQGKVTLISTAADGFYRVHLTSGELNAAEKSHATYIIERLGVEVISGKLYCGDGINIPGGNVNHASDFAIPVPNGQYALTVYAINQNDEGSLPDIVICIYPRTEGFQPYNEELRLEWDANTYLYANKPKLKLGRKLKGKVWKTSRTESGLIIKSDYNWPESHWGYDAILEDMGQIKRGDRIIFKTIGIDEDNKLFIGSLINRTPKED